MAFRDDFESLTGHPPFPWQSALYVEFTNKRIRRTYDISTGLGKTSFISVWLLALAQHAAAGSVVGFPRRLIYVVNRRTVVDQATREAERIVLPGYDDPAHYRRRLARGVGAAEQKDLLGKLHDRTDRLIRKAILQAGFSSELAEHAQIEWSRVGFLAGTGLADQYGIPDHLKRFSRLHVRIGWRDRLGRPVDVPGPCVLGGGRFYGLGMLAA